jgi:hypothetical protein
MALPRRALKAEREPWLDASVMPTRTKAEARGEMADMTRSWRRRDRKWNIAWEGGLAPAGALRIAWVFGLYPITRRG